MKIFVDVDGTICTRRLDLDYSHSRPLRSRIEKINKLYDEGHEIIYWTARGSRTGKDWYLFTKKQLSEWGVKYHNFMTGKPEYDIFIDDKHVNAIVLDEEDPLREALIQHNSNNHRVLPQDSKKGEPNEA